VSNDQFKQGLFTLLTAIALLFFVILVVLLINNNWHLVETWHFIVLLGVFLLFPIYGGACYYFGKWNERNRQRVRINDFIAARYNKFK